MLNGVGGNTIAAAQANMSYAEFCRWVAYRQRRGSLHPGMRVEHGAALVASILANVNSKKGGFKPQDFMPHMQAEAMSLEEAMEQWS